MIKKCKICGTEFEAKSNRACYCSPECKAIAQKEINKRKTAKYYENNKEKRKEQFKEYDENKREKNKGLRKTLDKHGNPIISLGTSKEEQEYKYNIEETSKNKIDAFKDLFEDE